AGVVKLQTPHPATGERVTINMDRDGFLGAVRTLLYSADISAVLPLALHEAHTHGNWAPLLAAVHTIVYEMSEQPSHVGMYLSVICAEDVAHISDAEIAAATRGTYAGDTFVRQSRRFCDVW